MGLVKKGIVMKYIRMKDGIYEEHKVPCLKCEYFSENILIGQSGCQGRTSICVYPSADTIEELCDSFEVVRFDRTTFKYKSYKEAFDLWLGDGYQNVPSKMYGLINGKRVAIMTGYTEGKNPDKLELELL